MTLPSSAILVSVPDPAEADPVLEALWRRVLDAWDDDKAHSALIDHGLRTQALPELAGRYRALLEDADKGAVARTKLDAIVIAATQMLWSMKTPAPGKVPLSLTLTAFGICALLLAWLGWAVWGQR
jgi:hypothetical protein